MADIYDVIQALQTGDLPVAEAWIFDHLKSKQISERTADNLTFFIMKVKYLSLLSDIPLCGDNEKVCVLRVYSSDPIHCGRCDLLHFDSVLASS
mmetsp:Transcript_7190/g.12074  ORF Transcript_7190/g.12074 Transcript_7190/m.12074 type:complete len:94 (+) Transcript_7190:743-1024(+)